MKKLLLVLLIASNAYAAPNKAKWEANMRSWGKVHCDNLVSAGLNFDEKLLSTYYDGEQVFYQIYNYTKDQYWQSCAKNAEAVYRDSFLIKNNGALPGYWLFPHGLVADVQLTNDAASASALNTLLKNGLYVQSGEFEKKDLPSSERSREAAYSLMVHTQNKVLTGVIDLVRFKELKKYIYGHFDQWFTSKTAPYVRPFMVALSSQALIESLQVEADANVLSTLVKAADAMWDTCYLINEKTMVYTDRNVGEGRVPAYDLNLLIAPVYAWLYKQTGVQKYKDRAELLIEGGIDNAFLGNGKQFNQNYRWSFSVWDWLGGLPTEPPKPTPTPTNTPTATPTPVMPSMCESLPPPSSMECTNYLLRQIRDSVKK